MPEFSTASESSPPTPGARYALLIGIERYPTGIARLPGPATDVEELHDLLVNGYKFPASNVRTLLNEQATREAVITAINTHLRRAGPDGLVFLYFSGHGVRMSRNYSVQDQEATHTDQALFVWGANSKPSVILDDELGYLLRQMNSPRVILVVDACHSGTISQFHPADSKSSGADRLVFHNRSAGQLNDDSSTDLPTRWLSDASPTNLPDIDMASGPFLALMATEERTRAYSANNWPARGQRHGVFTYYFTRALRNADGTRTAREFFRGVQSQVAESDVCKRHKRCQTPQIGGTQADARLMDLLGRQ